MKSFVRGALLASACLAATPAMAQDQDARIDALIAEIEALKAEVAELKGDVAEAKSANAVAWKGAPQLEQKKEGWSFKPRGRLMYDVATVDAPDAIDDAGLGFSNELRRGRLGVEGDIPGGFGYKLELDFAPGEPEFTDAYLSYEDGGLEVIVGQHNNFQSLEELTSSLHTSFIERAAFTDAFGFERRVGASVQYKAGDLIAQAGLFTDSIGDLNGIGDENNSRGADGRIVFAPKMGANQLHFGGSIHTRKLGDAISGVRYRQRPAVHSTDTRFIDTGSLGATSETGYGLEAAGIFGRFHVAGESYWQQVSRPEMDDPTFFGAYAEAGFFLTKGDTRGYKGGKFDRVKPASPVGEGGFGSLQLNARWDHLDLNDAGVVGGTQNAYQLSLNWKPVDYVLFGLNYAHIEYDDAAILADGEGSYGVDMIGLRSQVDF
ncbi:OprO/OprP family phosphate-selective porin [Sphingomicrobium nitratireducens]|uniref:OprO/OprP family phosphate-selective porin n=1 Tax=Sphingomicrobium nitratireducens TaxID=2964666 RepID=UPI00224015C8|nr:porin [Sphingomicrobium nitratireducens]